MAELMIRDLSIFARDGFPLSTRLVSAAAPRVAVLVSSGTGFPKSFYDRFARHLAERGGAVLTYDFRGIGGSRPSDLAALRMDYPDWGRLDMPAALDALMQAAPGLPVVHVGHSVGGHFLGFMDNHARIARHAFISVGSGYWARHFPSNWALELFFWFGLGPFHLWRRGYVKGGGLWRGADLPRGVFTTWRRWCLKPAYFRDELRDRLKPHVFEAVAAPIRSWIFSDDPIANPRTGADMLAVYPNAETELIVRTPADYGVSRIAHEGAFRKGLEPLWDEILDWLVAPRPDAPR